MSYEVMDFKKEVLDRSYQIPVLVDFWAEWCGPCRMLGPLLEKLAAGHEKWVLAKVDTEAHSNVARKYKVSSIPNVKLFVDGQVTDQFTGALPEASIRKWLERAVPGKFDKKLKEAQNLLGLQQDKAARLLLEEILAQEPANALARLLLARTFLLEDWSKAADIVRDIKTDPAYDSQLKTVQTLTSLFNKGEHPESLPENALTRKHRRRFSSALYA